MRPEAPQSHLARNVYDAAVLDNLRRPRVARQHPRDRSRCSGDHGSAQVCACCVCLSVASANFHAEVLCSVGTGCFGCSALRACAAGAHARTRCVRWSGGGGGGAAVARTVAEADTREAAGHGGGGKRDGASGAAVAWRVSAHAPHALAQACMRAVQHVRARVHGEGLTRAGRTRSCEVMLSVPAQPHNVNVCLVPTESMAGKPSASSDQLPAVLREHAVMALTAFDPPGTTREREANAAANARLWADILQLPTAPACAWRSFGFDADEGWREDGFCLAFDSAHIPAARHAVLELARRHDQGAIFEYSYDAKECRLMRRTLGACLDMPDESAVCLTPVSMCVCT